MGKIYVNVQNYRRNWEWWLWCGTCCIRQNTQEESRFENCIQIIETTQRKLIEGI